MQPRIFVVETASLLFIVLSVKAKKGDGVAANRERAVRWVGALDVMVAGMVVELLCAAAASYSKWCSWRCCLFRVRSERTVALLAHKVFVFQTSGLFRFIFIC